MPRSKPRPSPPQPTKYDATRPLQPLPASLRAAAPALIIAAAFAFLAGWSWRKWPDVLIDSGKEVYVPWRLSEGDVLYRDIEFSMGPLSQAFNALLFRLFGPSFSVLFYANLAILACIVALIYRLFARLGTRFSAAVVCLVFLVLFAFSQYANVGNYNYVFPYRHEMTHGIALALLLVDLWVGFVESGRLWRLVLAGLCLGLIALTKTEIFAPAAAASLLAGVLLGVRRKPAVPHALKRMAIFAAPLFLPALVSIALLARHMPLGRAVAGTFANWIYTANPQLTAGNTFYQHLMGLDAPLFFLIRMVIAALWMTAVVVVAVILDRIIPTPTRWRRTIFTGLGIALFYAGWYGLPQPALYAVAAPLPFIALAAVVLSCRAAARSIDEEQFRRGFLASLWSTLALFLLAKLGLYPQFEHYGFVLAMPAALLLVHVLIEVLPAFLQVTAGKGGLARTLLLALVATVALRYFQIANTYYRQKVVPFGTAGDLILLDPTFGGRHTVVPELVHLLSQEMPAGSTLVSMPEGAILNYMLRVPSTSRHHLLSPWEMNAAGGERRVLDELAERPPTFFVVLQMPMGEHGYDYFGEPRYGAQILEWIRASYDTVHTLRGLNRQGELEVQALVFKRRPPAPTDPDAAPPS